MWMRIKETLEKYNLIQRNQNKETEYMESMGCCSIVEGTSVAIE